MADSQYEIFDKVTIDISDAIAKYAQLGKLRDQAIAGGAGGGASAGSPAATQAVQRAQAEAKSVQAGAQAQIQAYARVGQAAQQSAATQQAAATQTAQVEIGAANAAMLARMESYKATGAIQGSQYQQMMADQTAFAEFQKRNAQAEVQAKKSGIDAQKVMSRQALRDMSREWRVEGQKLADSIGDMGQLSTTSILDSVMGWDEDRINGQALAREISQLEASMGRLRDQGLGAGNAEWDELNKRQTVAIEKFDTIANKYKGAGAAIKGYGATMASTMIQGAVFGAGFMAMQAGVEALMGMGGLLVTNIVDPLKYASDSADRFTEKIMKASSAIEYMASIGIDSPAMEAMAENIRKHAEMGRVMSERIDAANAQYAAKTAGQGEALAKFVASNFKVADPNQAWGNEVNTFNMLFDKYNFGRLNKDAESFRQSIETAFGTEAVKAWDDAVASGLDTANINMDQFLAVVNMTPEAFAKAAREAGNLAAQTGKISMSMPQAARAVAADIPMMSAQWNFEDQAASESRRWDNYRSGIGLMAEGKALTFAQMSATQSLLATEGGRLGILTDILRVKGQSVAAIQAEMAAAQQNRADATWQRQYDDIGRQIGIAQGNITSGADGQIAVYQRRNESLDRELRSLDMAGRAIEDNQQRLGDTTVFDSRIAGIERETKGLEQQGRALDMMDRSYDRQLRAIDMIGRGLDLQGRALDARNRALDDQGRALDLQIRPYQQQLDLLDDQQKAHERLKSIEEDRVRISRSRVAEAGDTAASLAAKVAEAQAIAANNRTDRSFDDRRSGIQDKIDGLNDRKQALDDSRQLIADERERLSLSQQALGDQRQLIQDRKQLVSDERQRLSDVKLRLSDEMAIVEARRQAVLEDRQAAFDRQRQALADRRQSIEDAKYENGQAMARLENQQRINDLIAQQSAMRSDKAFADDIKAMENELRIATEAAALYEAAVIEAAEAAELVSSRRSSLRKAWNEYNGWQDGMERGKASAEAYTTWFEALTNNAHSSAMSNLMGSLGNLGGLLNTAGGIFGGIFSGASSRASWGPGSSFGGGGSWAPRNAVGGVGMVTRPSYIPGVGIVGEAGPEEIRITPQSQLGQDKGGRGIAINISIGNERIKDFIATVTADERRQAAYGVTTSVF